MGNWKLIEKRLSETRFTVEVDGALAAFAIAALSFAFGFTLGVFA